MSEIVTASDPTGYFGLLTGPFSGGTVSARPQARRYSVSLMHKQAFCRSKESACIVFLEDSLAAFGSLNSLKAILEARQGMALPLNSNRDLTSLLRDTERQAPVRGVLFGREVETAVSGLFGNSNTWKKQWSELSQNVTAVAYSIQLDSTAHVHAALQCKSATTASLLSGTLSALSRMKSMASSLFNTAGAMPFEISHVSSSDRIVDIRGDCPIT